MQRVAAMLIFCLAPLVPTDSVPAQDDSHPLPPAQAVQAIGLPQGFQATLFASEPDVKQPMAFTIDDRGRLWVLECYSYPKWETKGGPGHDRILIFEDSDGDGRFDSRKVFWDRGVNVSGLAVGFGGVWLCATPNFLFLPDSDGDDQPDGPVQVLLDGWDLKAKHNVFNGLTWGPDGWLYGCNGILSNSLIGKPGVADDRRVAFNCGVWRYHPTEHRFEVVAWGTTNPWGLDFDDFGEMFITNCVIKHLFHVPPGAHFKRMYGQDLNPYTYELIESCADHIHWGGGRWQDSRGGVGIHDSPGGGHAHAGAMIYLGDNWPDEYRNRLFTCNLHGRRINQDLLKPKGSGYRATHGNDFMQSNDPWFRGLELEYGPDGGVYITDWSDTGECHDYEDIQQQDGRIFKITYGRPTASPTNVAALADDELVRLQLHRNDWYVRHARRVLQERAVKGNLAAATQRALQHMLRNNPDVTRQLRALWAIYVTGGLDDRLVLELLHSARPRLRAWAVRLALDDRVVSKPILAKLVQMAQSDASAIVRLSLASGMQRLELHDRWEVAAGLATHAEDAADANLPLMVWYGIEPLVRHDRRRALSLVPRCKIPLIRRFVARRIASLAD